MSGANSQQDVDIDLGGLFGAIWRNRMRVLLATVACAGIAFAGASLVTPRYKSEARLLIETREPAFTTGSDRTQGRDPQPALDELGIASQVQLLRSADLIKQVARNMKLYELEEFDPAAKPSAISDLLVLSGLKKSPLDTEPEERVLKEFTDKLAVYQVERSRVSMRRRASLLYFGAIRFAPTKATPAQATVASRTRMRLRQIAPNRPPRSISTSCCLS